MLDFYVVLIAMSTIQLDFVDLVDLVELVVVMVSLAVHSVHSADLVVVALNLVVHSVHSADLMVVEVNLVVHFDHLAELHHLLELVACCRYAVEALAESLFEQGLGNVRKSVEAIDPSGNVPQDTVCVKHGIDPGFAA
jgi:hypothetical protein